MGPTGTRSAASSEARLLSESTIKWETHRKQKGSRQPDAPAEMWMTTVWDAFMKRQRWRLCINVWQNAFSSLNNPPHLSHASCYNPKQGGWPPPRPHNPLCSRAKDQPDLSLMACSAHLAAELALTKFICINFYQMFNLLCSLRINHSECRSLNPSVSYTGG